MWLGLRRADAFPVSPRALVRGLRRRGDHVVPDRGLRRLLDRHLGVRRLEDAAVPLHVVAYDVGAGEERLLSDGPAADAVLASAAVPGLLPPVRRDGAVLVDGGVVNNTPVSHAVALGAQRVVVLSTQPSRVAAAPPRGPVAMALHAFTLLIGSRLEADAARYAGRVELLVIDAAGAGRVAPTDFTRARELVAAGLAASRSALADPHPKETIRHALDQPLLSVA